LLADPAGEDEEPTGLATVIADNLAVPFAGHRSPSVSRVTSATRASAMYRSNRR
jgi:hypothetical protein